ncbi:hypothetical protein Q7P35_010476 [Cladosporium inversicolor]
MAPCSACRNAKVKKDEERPKCIVGPQSMKCSKCMKLCDARDALRRDIEKVEEEEIEIMQKQSKLLQELTARRMKKVRLRKQLRLSESRANAAVAKELEELEAEDALE